MIDADKIATKVATQIIKEENIARRKVVVYPGRFQPMHPGHYGLYKHLVDKFGKDNVFIGTSNKVNKPRSPFNFREKQRIMTKLFGIPKNKIVQVKSPYAPKEIMSKFDKDEVAYITVISQKDKGRLGGSYFEDYRDDKDLLSYGDKGYVYVAPMFSGGVSGTEVRSKLGEPSSSEEIKKMEFKRIYGKLDKRMFDLITDKLTESVIMEWLIERNGQLFEIPKADVKKVDQYADKQLDPIDVDLTSNHFFQRLNDPRNNKDISAAELIGFFKRLKRNKKEFIDFLNKYKQIVVTDNRSKLNIPFMKKANKAIAKTIMRKPNFKTSNPKITVDHKDKFNRLEYYKEHLDDLTPESFKVLIENNYIKVEEKDKLKGGLADGMTLADLAEKHGVSLDDIKKEFKMGVKVEMEHTGDKEVSIEIAKDHLFEDPKYYTKLKTIEEAQFTINPGFKFVAKKSLKNLKRGAKYVVNDIKGRIGDLTVLVNKVGDSTVIPINVRSEAEFYADVIDEGHDFVICRECGNKYKQIMQTHTKSKHGITLKEYKNKYSEAPLVCEVSKNIGKDNPMKKDNVRKKHKKSVNTLEYKNKISEALQGKNKGNKRPDVVKKNKDPEFRKKVSEGVKKSYENNPELRKERSKIGKKYGFGSAELQEKLAEIKGYTDPSEKDAFIVYQELVRRKSNENYQKHFDKIPNAKKRNRDYHLDHKFSIKEGFDADIPINVVSHYKNLRVIDGRLNESKGPNSSILIDELVNDIRNSDDPIDNRILLQCGGAYGHMAHPFDLDIDLTFGDLKNIVNLALEGKLELTTEKLDGMALAISWRDDKGGLIAARNKSHLKNSGVGAMDIDDVKSKFAGRGALTDAYEYAVKDLENAISKLSGKQREKIFQNGSSFMNVEVIYPESANVIPYNHSMLVFHGTMQYDEDGNAIGENKEAGRILAGMIKQINADMQEYYNISGPVVQELPKSEDLSKKKPKFLKAINKLQKEFKLRDNDGVGEYHQAWWENWVDENAPRELDNRTKMHLVKRWAFFDRSNRINGKTMPDDEIKDWAKKVDKQKHGKIASKNLRKFENIFLALGAEVLSYMSSAITANPDEAVQKMKNRLDKTIKDITKSGNEQQIAKLKKELERLEQAGGTDKIVPNEGIVFVYKGHTLKLTGTFASLNQILGLMYKK